jgi:GT2 family glycosyltransferase
MTYSRSDSENPRIAVIVPYYSGSEQLNRCINGILDCSYERADIVIVDHSGNDDLSDQPQLSNPRVTRLEEPESLWWTGATNRGLDYALDHHYHYVMLLNHDCFVRRETISLLVESERSQVNCIIAPVQHHLDSGHDIVRATSCFLLGFSTLILPDWLYSFSRKERLAQTSLIIGGRGALFHADTFRTIGKFDEEHFPHYGADHDFYLRARKNGYRLLIDTQAFVDIDNVKSSTGGSGRRQTLRSFYHSLFDRRSHRNLADQYNLFTRYYPIPYLGFVGVVLNVGRYAAVTAVSKLIQLFSAENPRRPNQR